MVELEIQLDEIKEQYNNVIRNSNSKAQQKKMAFLERNLEQLTLVQKQVGRVSTGAPIEHANRSCTLACRPELCPQEGSGHRRAQAAGEE